MTTDNSAQPASVQRIETAGLPFRTADELGDLWRARVGGREFSERWLWVASFDARPYLHRAVPLAIPGPPEPDFADLLVSELSEVIDKDCGIRVASLLTRPGVDGIAPWDRGWARLLHSASERFGLPMEPMFRANAADVVEVPPSVTRRC